MRAILVLVLAAVLLAVPAAAGLPDTIVLSGATGTTNYTSLQAGYIDTVSAYNSGTVDFYLEFYVGGVINTDYELYVPAEGPPVSWPFKPSDRINGVRVVVPSGSADGYVVIGNTN